MDYSDFILIVADLIKFCFPISLVFAVSAKLYRLAIDFMFNRKVEF